jgi:glycosyltransferase involved in cell wall biosynthesis
MKPAIINIMPHEPAYHFSPDEKPDFYWEKPDGSILGFWKREWPDLLGESFLKETDRFKWEVWQPDYRADKSYSQKIETGVTHYLLPAEDKIYRPGIRSQKGIFSKAIIEKIDALKNHRIILQLHGFRVPFYNEILKVFGPRKKFPIFLIGHGMAIAPISEIFSLHRPLTYLCLIAEQLRLKNVLKCVDIISVQSEAALRETKKVYDGRIEKLTMGCDFSFWTPLPSLETRQLIRRKLNIPLNATVFFATGNFGPLKQLDKLIRCFSSINRDDFFLLIAGHGDSANTTLLSSLIAPLIKQNRALLHPYIEGDGLRNLYWASDIYISTSTNEGSSVAIMKAMACVLPILSTSVGETTETMKKYGVGQFINTTNYLEWEKTIINVLDHGLPEPIEVHVARELYDWKNVSGQFISIYHDLLNQSNKSMK